MFKAWFTETECSSAGIVLLLGLMANLEEKAKGVRLALRFEQALDLLDKIEVGEGEKGKEDWYPVPTEHPLDLCGQIDNLERVCGGVLVTISVEKSGSHPGLEGRLVRMPISAICRALSD